jgi:hypothetical protein
LDRIIHAAYVVVCFLIKSDIGQKEWKWYLDGHSGCHDFQIDLALSLMNDGIGLQWDGIQWKDQTLCDKILLSHVIAANVLFV